MNVAEFVEAYHKGEISLNESNGFALDTRFTGYIPSNLIGAVKLWNELNISTPEKFQKAFDMLEDRNDHDGCAFLKCKRRGDAKAAKTIILIAAVCENIGHTPKELNDLRYRTAYKA